MNQIMKNLLTLLTQADIFLIEGICLTDVDGNILRGGGCGWSYTPIPTPLNMLGSPPREAAAPVAASLF